jgi:hypothetical protein
MSDVAKMTIPIVIGSTFIALILYSAPKRVILGDVHVSQGPMKGTYEGVPFDIERQGAFAGGSSTLRFSHPTHGKTYVGGGGWSVTNTRTQYGDSLWDKLFENQKENTDE